MKAHDRTDMKQSFSTSEVAKYCHVTADTIRKWAESRRIQVFKTPGGHRRIRREDLIRFLRENNIPIHPDLSDSGVRVLVVDHEKTSISVVQRFLERAQTPFEVQVASDAFGAGQQVATFRPDVIFLDLHLPGLDGLDVCRRIKFSPDFGGTHIIALASVEDGPANCNRVYEQGAAACLRKPFTPDDLRRVLAKVGIEVN